MKSAKMVFICCITVLVLGLGSSAYATPVTYSLIIPSGYEERFYFTPSKGSLGFFAERVEPDPIIPKYWQVDSDYFHAYNEPQKNKKLTYVTEGTLSGFEITSDNNMESRYHFTGEIAAQDLFGKTATDDLPWYIYGHFLWNESNSANTMSDFIGFISDTAPSTSPSAVPEPATMMLVGTGMLCMAAVRRKKKK